MTAGVVLVTNRVTRGSGVATLLAAQELGVGAAESQRGRHQARRRGAQGAERGRGQQHGAGPRQVPGLRAGAAAHGGGLYKLKNPVAWNRLYPHSLKAPGFNHYWTCEVETWFLSLLLSTFNLYRYSTGAVASSSGAGPGGGAPKLVGTFHLVILQPKHGSFDDSQCGPRTYLGFRV
jgi:hypothetical protein